MGELGGTVEYLYWSARRTGRFLKDKDTPIPTVTHTIIGPAFSWLPTFSRSTTNSGNLRPQVAKAIERVGPDSRYSIQSAWLDPVRERYQQYLPADDDNESCLVMQDIEGNEFDLD